MGSCSSKRDDQTRDLDEKPIARNSLTAALESTPAELVSIDDVVELKPQNVNEPNQSEVDEAKHSDGQKDPKRADETIHERLQREEDELTQLPNRAPSNRKLSALPSASTPQKPPLKSYASSPNLAPIDKTPNRRNAMSANSHKRLLDQFVSQGIASPKAMGVLASPRRDTMEAALNVAFMFEPVWVPAPLPDVNLDQNSNGSNNSTDNMSFRDEVKNLRKKRLFSDSPNNDAAIEEKVAASESKIPAVDTIASNTDSQKVNEKTSDPLPDASSPMHGSTESPVGPEPIDADTSILSSKPVSSLPDSKEANESDESDWDTGEATVAYGSQPTTVSKLPVPPTVIPLTISAKPKSNFKGKHMNPFIGDQHLGEVIFVLFSCI